MTERLPLYNFISFRGKKWENLNFIDFFFCMKLFYSLHFFLWIAVISCFHLIISKHLWFHLLHLWQSSQVYCISVCMCAKSLQSSLTLCSLWTIASRLLCLWHSPGKCTGVGCHAFLQGIFPTQRSNQCLLHLLLWQVGSLPLVHLGSPHFCILLVNGIITYMLVYTITFK